MGTVTHTYNAATRCGEIHLYDAIGSGLFGDGIKATDVATALQKMQGASKIEIVVNSPGGDVWEGLALYNLLARFPAQKTARIDGLCASIASIVALAADRRVTARNARWMLHNAKASMFGGVSAEEARNLAKRLDETNALMAGTYAERTGQSRAEVLRLMAEETWLSADDAKRLGFTHEISDGSGRATAHAGHPLLAYFARVPDTLRPIAVASHETTPPGQVVEGRSVEMLRRFKEAGSGSSTITASPSSNGSDRRESDDLLRRFAQGGSR